MRKDDSNTKTEKPRGRFMPWPFQAAMIALIAALGVAAIAD
ncbi:MAG: hypothetical protein ACO1OG_02820 [Devosia sp.]